MKELESKNRAKELDALSNVRNSKEFWTTLRKFTPRAPSTCPLPVEAWESYYTAHHTINLPRLRSFRFVHTHPVLDSAISFKETLKTLSQLSNNIAPGPNGLTNEFYKNLPPPGIAAITNLFNKVLCSGSVPDCWGWVKTIVLHKKGDRMDHNNYRNIALFNCIAKIYTLLIANRMRSWAEHAKIIPEYQGSFRKNRGCDDNLFSLLSAIQIAMNQPGRYLFAIFVDFKQAFDSVQHHLLWDRLRDLGLGSKALNSIIDLYEKLYMFYEINGVRSNKLKISIGTPQGDPISPLLFILFISGLEQHLRDAGFEGSSLGRALEILTLAYADDIVLLADTAQATQKILNALATFCAALGLSVNTKKTQIIIFHKSPKYLSMPVFTYNGNIIVTPKSYTYLGSIFSRSGKFNKAVIDRISKINQAIGSSLNKLRRAQPKSSLPAEKLYNAVVSTTLLYGAEFWADGREKQLRATQSKYFKQLYGWPRSTPHYVVRLETKNPSLDIEILKNKLRWLVKLLNMDESRLPRKCYTRLLGISNRNPDSPNANWVSTLRRELALLGFAAIFDEQNPEQISEHIELIVAKKADVLKRYDLDRTYASSFCPIYKSILQEEPNYLHFNLSRNKLRLISQARVSSKRGVYFFWDNLRIKLNAENSCPVCNWDCPDDLQHFLTACVASDQIRGKFSSLGHSVQEILRVGTPRDADVLFIFLKNLIALRFSIASS